MKDLEQHGSIGISKSHFNLQLETQLKAEWEAVGTEGTPQEPGGHRDIGVTIESTMSEV